MAGDPHIVTLEDSPETAAAGAASHAGSSSPQPADDAPHPSAPGLPAACSSGAAPEEDDFKIPEPEPAYQKVLEESEHPTVKEGDLCKGEVVSVSPAGVFVDIGRKTEGVVDLSDFSTDPGPPSPGDAIDVVVTSLGGPGEPATLSYLSARQRILWSRIESAYRETAALTGRIVGQVKGGLAVDLGVHAFLPVSHIDIKPAGDLELLVGQDIDVRVLKFNKARGNVVVSRRVILEAELLRLKKETLAKLSEGAVVSGTVKNLTSYGAFVDLGGLDALLHVTDISYSRVKHPSDVIQVGDSIAAKVLKFDPEREKVSLSLKAMEPDPWEGAEERYQEGQRVTGRVVSTTEYGVFVELEKGLEGLIHSSEISWSRRGKRRSKALKASREVECLVVNVDREARRVSLSIKRLKPDPWIDAAERYPKGTVVEGRVLNIAPYGAFIEIEEGIDGLVHLSDLTRDSKVRRPQELLKKGENTRAVVLSVDTKNRRIALGIKQLEPDAWDTFFGTYLVGDMVTGRVTSQAKYGVFVELAPGVEALCHSSEIRNNSRKKSKGALRAGKSYSFKIIGLAEFEKRIRLSRRGLPDQAPEPHERDETSETAKPSDDAMRAEGGGLTEAAAAAPSGTPKGPAKSRRRKTAKPRVRKKKPVSPTDADQPADVVEGVAAATQAEGSQEGGVDGPAALTVDSTGDLVTSAQAAPGADQRTENDAARRAAVLEAPDGASAVDLPTEEKRDPLRPIEAEPSSEGAPETDLSTVDAPPDAGQPAT